MFMWKLVYKSNGLDQQGEELMMEQKLCQVGDLYFST